MPASRPIARSVLKAAPVAYADTDMARHVSSPVAYASDIVKIDVGGIAAGDAEDRADLLSKQVQACSLLRRSRALPTARLAYRAYQLHPMAAGGRGAFEASSQPG